MTIVVAQNNNSTSGTATITAPYISAQIAGNANIIGIRVDASSTGIVVSDSSGNTYVQDVAYVDPAFGTKYYFYRCFSIVAAAAGSNTVTVTMTASSPGGEIFILEVSGGINAFDVTANGNGNSTALLSGAFTTTQANEIILAYCVCGSGTPTGIGSGYSILTSVSVFGDFIEGKIVTSTQTGITATATQNTGFWNIIVATYAVSLTLAPTDPIGFGAPA